MSNYRKIGMVVAMAKEIGPMLATLGERVGVVEKNCFRADVYKYHGIEIYLSECGIGQIAAAVAT